MLLNSWNYMIYQSCEVILLKSYVCFAFKARKYFLSGWIKKKAFRNLHSLTNFKHSLLSLNRNLCLWNMLLMLLCFGSKYKSKFQPYFYALLAFYKKKWCLLSKNKRFWYSSVEYFSGKPQVRFTRSRMGFSLRFPRKIL